MVILLDPRNVDIADLLAVIRDLTSALDELRTSVEGDIDDLKSSIAQRLDDLAEALGDPKDDGDGQHDAT